MPIDRNRSDTSFKDSLRNDASVEALHQVLPQRMLVVHNPNSTLYQESEISEGRTVCDRKIFVEETKGTGHRSSLGPLPEVDSYLPQPSSPPPLPSSTSQQEASLEAVLQPPVPAAITTPIPYDTVGRPRFRKLPDLDLIRHTMVDVSRLSSSGGK